MAIIYENLRRGAIADNPLSAAATVVTSPQFVLLPPVAAPDIMWLSFDPAEVDGPGEVVRVTAHAPGAPTLTVVRGQQDTTAREHAQSTLWTNAWTRDDARRVDAELADLDERLGLTHVIAVPSTTWFVPHTLGYVPSVSTFDTFGQQIEGEVIHDSATLVRVEFAYTTAGEVHLS